MKRPVASFLLTACQVPAFGLAGTLEYLSTRRMGVMRDLAFRRQVLTANVLAPSALNAYKLVLLVGLVSCLAALLARAGGRRSAVTTGGLLGASALSLAGLGLLVLPAAERLLAYPFFLLAVVIALALQYGKLLLQLRRAGFPLGGPPCR